MENHKSKAHEEKSLDNNKKGQPQITMDEGMVCGPDGCVLPGNDDKSSKTFKINRSDKK